MVFWRKLFQQLFQRDNPKSDIDGFFQEYDKKRENVPKARILEKEKYDKLFKKREMPEGIESLEAIESTETDINKKR